MPMYVSVIILLLVVLFLVLTFAIAATLVGWGLRERETEWPANWSATAEGMHPAGSEGSVRAQGADSEAESETEAAAGSHHVA